MSLESKALRIRTVVTDLRAYAFFFRGKIRIVPRNPWGNYSQGLLGGEKNIRGRTLASTPRVFLFRKGSILLAAEGVEEVLRLVISSLS